MKVAYRNHNLDSSLAVKKDKMLIVFLWILEFRFANTDILGTRLELNYKRTSAFLKLLCDSNLLRPFTNDHTDQKRFFMLTADSVSILSDHGYDVSKSTTRVASLGKYSQIMHDLGLQYFIIRNLNRYDEVIWDRNIDIEDRDARPDALVKNTEKQYWSAIEYERSRKDKKRVFYKLHGHAQKLLSKKYTGVVYVFDKDTDRRFYQDLFNETAWPVFKRQKKSGTLVSQLEEFYPDETEYLRKRFVFITTPPR